ncbi:PAS-domain containing protein [Rhodobacteraceae bacterium KMM 6894]|nr:PAS-domain containing protein [Rhodobacteraceae bacterium KMM 6894]
MSTESNRVAADILVRESLDHLGQGVTIFDGDLRLISWNQQFLDLLNFPHDLAFEGAHFESFIRHNAERGEYGPGDIEAQIHKRVQQARAFVAHEFEREAGNGKILRVAGTPLPSGGFVTVYSDVTQDKTREKSLEQSVANRTIQLDLSEARLQMIADEVPAGIAHIDSEMHFLFVNKRFARAYDLDPSQMIGKRCKDILHARTLQNSSRFFEQARRGAVVDFEIEITLPNGQRKDVRTYLRPEGPSDGTVIGFYILSLDVTKRNIANAALLQSHKMDALGRMSSGISHDFNNLLAIILGNLIPLRERIGDKELREDYLDPAISAARRGGDLTRRLLSLAKSESVDPSAVHVGKLVTDMIELLRSSLPHDITVNFMDSTDTTAAIVDPAKLEMALLNLFMNARDAMGAQGCLSIKTELQDLKAGEAELHKLPVGSYVKISVTDDGIGISSEEQERVFEPFFTLKGNKGGTGLGLAMVFGFVRESNGIISVNSEPGVGTTFSILLPSSDFDPSLTDSDPDRKLPDVQGAPDRPLVLLVEDDEGVRTVVRRQLIELGYPLIEAEDAMIALKLFRSIPEIDLMLSDISMPGDMDGLALADRLSHERPDLGIVLMSGQRTSLKEFGKTVPYPFLPKPFDKHDLAEALLAVQGIDCVTEGTEM